MVCRTVNGTPMSPHAFGVGLGQAKAGVGAEGAVHRQVLWACCRHAHPSRSDPGSHVVGARWKLVHGDVFRAPRALELLAALVGTGVQLALLVLSVILITIAGARPAPPRSLPHLSSAALTLQLAVS